MNNYYRFYRAVWVGRVTALPTHELFGALVGTYHPTTDTDLRSAIYDLAYEELVKRGEISPRGSATLETVSTNKKLVGQGYGKLRSWAWN